MKKSNSNKQCRQKQLNSFSYLTDVIYMPCNSFIKSIQFSGIYYMHKMVQP